jgi:DNA invertase Pin-like site-specific DNA recombinase
MKTKRKMTSAIEVARKNLLQEQPSTHIKPVTSLKRGRTVDLWIRVSGGTQAKNENPRDQERNLRRQLAERGILVGDVNHSTGSSWKLSTLIAAAEKASRRGRTLVAESTDRFIRPPDFHAKRRWNAQANGDDLSWLIYSVPAELATLSHPDEPPARVRSRQTKRGQSEKGRKGGRPTKPGHKKRRRQRLRPIALKLHREGYSYRRIASRLRVPFSTISRWIQSHP